MAWLHSFYISNAKQELNYISKDLSNNPINQIMQDYIKSFIPDSGIFEINAEKEDDDNVDSILTLLKI